MTEDKESRPMYFERHCNEHQAHAEHDWNDDNVGTYHCSGFAIPEGFNFPE